jgi:hypothetical protein
VIAKTNLLSKLLITLVLSIFSGCAADPMVITSISTATVATQTTLAQSLTSFKVTFNNTDYYSALVPQSLADCAGDVKNYYQALELNTATGGPAILPISDTDATTTIQPSFIKDVSVDLTYTGSTGANNNAFACSYGSDSSAPAPSNCANFDYLAVTPPGALGYGIGYYSMFDSNVTNPNTDVTQSICYGQGPISGGLDSNLLSGGVYFDIDRTQLGANENLLLHITSIPLNYSNTPPSGISSFGVIDNAQFNIHLIRTGLTQAALEQALQPRFLTYASTTTYPQIARKIAVLAPATGQIREEQVLIPLAEDGTIDRIRVEKYSGSAILVSASLYRLGAR